MATRISTLPRTGEAGVTGGAAPPPAADFLPFYERWLPPAARNRAGKSAVAAALALAFLAVHVAVVGARALTDGSPLLAALIAVAMACLYYATHTLRGLFPELDRRLRAAAGQDDAAPAEVYMAPLRRLLSNRNFALAGLGFGLVNCGVGLALGLSGAETYSLLWGYFLAGFVCGMAALGIVGAALALTRFAQHPAARASFDFTAPDRCGGTLFLGEALVIFGSVTLIVGVLISAYIFKKWQPVDTLTAAVQYFWVAFPYAMALAAAMAPALPLHEALREYKAEREAEFRARLAPMREALERADLTAEQRKDWRERYELQAKMREHLHGMRTWPFDLSAFVTGLAAFVPSLVTTTANTLELIGKRAG